MTHDLNFYNLPPVPTTNFVTDANAFGFTPTPSVMTFPFQNYNGLVEYGTAIFTPNGTITRPLTGEDQTQEREKEKNKDRKILWKQREKVTTNNPIAMSNTFLRPMPTTAMTPMTATATTTTTTPTPTTFTPMPTNTNTNININTTHTQPIQTPNSTAITTNSMSSANAPISRFVMFTQSERNNNIMNNNYDSWNFTSNSYNNNNNNNYNNNTNYNNNNNYNNNYASKTNYDYSTSGNQRFKSKSQKDDFFCHICKVASGSEKQFQLHCEGRKHMRNMNFYNTGQTDRIKNRPPRDYDEQILECKKRNDFSGCIEAIRAHLSGTSLRNTTFAVWLHGLSIILGRGQLPDIQELCCTVFAYVSNEKYDFPNINTKSLQWKMSAERISDLLNVILMSINLQSSKDCVDWFVNTFLAKEVLWDGHCFLDRRHKEQCFKQWWLCVLKWMGCLETMSRRTENVLNGRCYCQLSSFRTATRGGVTLVLRFQNADEAMKRAFEDVNWHKFVLLRSDNGNTNKTKLYLGRVSDIKFQERVLVVRVARGIIGYLQRNSSDNLWLEEFYLENVGMAGINLAVGLQELTNAATRSGGEKDWDNEDEGLTIEKKLTTNEKTMVRTILDYKSINDIPACMECIDWLASHTTWNKKFFTAWLHGLSLLLFHGQDVETGMDSTAFGWLQKWCSKIFITNTPSETPGDKKSSVRPSWLMTQERWEAILEVILLAVNVNAMKTSVVRSALNEQTDTNQRRITSHDCLHQFNQQFSGANKEEIFLKPIEWIMDTFARYEVQWSDQAFRNKLWKNYYFKHCWPTVADLVTSLRNIRHFFNENISNDACRFELIKVTNHTKHFWTLRFKVVVEKPSLVKYKMKDFVTGNFVILSSNDRNIAERQLLLGRLSHVKLTEGIVGVQIVGCALGNIEQDAIKWLQYPIIQDMGPSGISFAVQLEALADVVAPSSDVPDTFRKYLVYEDTDAKGKMKFDTEIDAFENPTSPVNTTLFQQLNQSQRKAVNSALQQHLTLIQGPPGTGKTQVASAIVEQFRIRNKDARVLVTGFSNIAADVLCKRLIEHQMDSLRLGIGSVLDEDEYQGVLLRHYPKQDWTKIVKSSPIIACTCVGAANVLLKKKTFDLVVIDESSQCTEMALLPPLRKLQPHASLVLIGDHKQLPPTVKSVYAKKRGLDMSLFERLINDGKSVEFLDTQYRMHRALTEFSSMEFYGGQLKTARDLRREPPRGFPWPVKDYPLCFVHVHGFHESRDAWMSTENNKEAHLIVKIACTLLGQNSSSGRITVITPYRAQRENIEAKLYGLYGRAHKQWFEVCTVDGFQGNESEVIIFSAVRANEMSCVGFLKERARVNVMLTRPRSGLIVVGNMTTLSKETLWNKWLEHVVVKNKSYIDSRQLEEKIK